MHYAARNLWARTVEGRLAPQSRPRKLVIGLHLPLREQSLGLAAAQRPGRSSSICCFATREITIVAPAITP